MSGSAYTRWYRVGTVTVTKGSRVVTGTDTYWLDAGLNPGDIFMTDLQTSYEIDTITDSTHLTLREPYQGATANGTDYKVIRNFTATLPADIAAKTAQLLGDFRRYVDTDMQSIQGKSAYEIACDHGYVGTESEWLLSLQGNSQEVSEIQEHIGEMTDLTTSEKETLVGAISEVNSGKNTNASSIGTLSGLTTTEKGNLVSAVNEVNLGKNSNAASIGVLSNLGTSAKGTLVAAVNEVNTGKDTNTTNIGTLSGLGTSAKSNLVSAINEVNTGKNTNASNISTLSTSVGTLSSLTTSAKGSLVAAVNELNSGKAASSTVGTLSSLTTTAKGSAVAAINEVNSGKNTNTTNIGTLSSLGTSAKTNLVAAINELNSGKAASSAVGATSSLNTSTKTNLVAAINEVNTGRGTNATAIGTLSSLGTSAKTNLVAAINEVNTAKNTNKTAIGTLTSLNTSAKTNLVAAVNEVNTAVSGIFNLDAINGTGIHNSIYRAMNLGTSVTSAQWTAIKDATFAGMWIGSYWDIAIPAYSWTDTAGTVHNESAISSVRFRIAGFDYALHYGGSGSDISKHHVLVITEPTLYTARMNSTATTDGGFIASEMYKNNLKRAEAIFTAAFGAAHILTHKDLLSNAMTDGKVSGTAWANVKVGLLTEAMLNGGYSLSLSNNLTSLGSSILPLFSLVPSVKLAKNLSGTYTNYWTSTPYNASKWVSWSDTDHIMSESAELARGVRPYALLYSA